MALCTYQLRVSDMPSPQNYLCFWYCHVRPGKPAQLEMTAGIDDRLKSMSFFFLSPVFSFFSENHLRTSSVYSILQISTSNFLESEESSVVK